MQSGAGPIRAPCLSGVAKVAMYCIIFYVLVQYPPRGKILKQLAIRCWSNRSPMFVRSLMKSCLVGFLHFFCHQCTTAIYFASFMVTWCDHIPNHQDWMSLPAFSALLCNLTFTLLDLTFMVTWCDHFPNHQDWMSLSAVHCFSI